MLLRVWNCTDHALAVAEARAAVKKIVGAFIVLIKTGNVYCEILDQSSEGKGSEFVCVAFEIGENIAPFMHNQR